MAKRKVIQNSWQKVGKWYGKITEGEGHYYHRNVIIPRVLELLNLKPSSKVLDMGCGSGILGRSIDKNINYVGVDLSPSLIKDAVRQDNNPNHKYLINDASKLEIKEDDFSDSIFTITPKYEKCRNGN